MRPAETGHDRQTSHGLLIAKQFDIYGQIG
jgi:hypothetical protein